MKTKGKYIEDEHSEKENITLKKHAGLVALFVLLFSHALFSHGITGGDQGYIQGVTGMNIPVFIYLGAKHMVTGYDHLLFLLGVIFFLFRLKDVGIYVTLFAVGHSTTLIIGVYTDIQVSAYLIDAIIGCSVVYKALDNLDAFKVWLGFQPNAKAATLFFGLFHGFGLAAKLQEFTMASEGLMVNLISFNIGVEIGQIISLSVILIVMGFWRMTANFQKSAFAANILLMTGGFVLTGYQLAGYLLD